MNLLTMLEDPLAATERILPWIVSTHIKDGGIFPGKHGLITFPSPLGRGIVDMKSVIKKLESLDKEIYLSVEDHGGSFFLPINEDWFIGRFPDLSGDEYNKLLDYTKITSGKIKDGELKVTERTDWPMICEERTKTDIRNLKTILERLNSD
jgi:sugar phosphate isomerase/epimerase